MSESEEIQDYSSSESSSLPEDLPPVKPPSAGFIVQLFLVPGLIVLVIVCVWALFGKLASSEQDWKKLLVEIKNTNTNRRWRAALGLAQMLRADENDQQSNTKLSDNPEIAKQMSVLLRDLLQTHSSNESDVKQQTFLARTLGFINQPQIVIPTLQEAMKPEYDIDVRKNAIISLAVIVDRAKTAGEEDQSPRMKEILAIPGLVESLILTSRDSDATVRQLTAYALGQVPSADSRNRLEVMIGDSDTHTKTNAALGLAQQNSKAGLPVFQEVLTNATESTGQNSDGNSLTLQKTAAASYFWYGVLLLTGLIVAGWGLLSDKKGMGSIAALGGLAGVFLGVWGIYIVAQSDADLQPKISSTELQATPQNIDEAKNLQYRQEHGNNLAVLSTLKAVEGLKEQLTEDEKVQIISLIQSLSEKHYLPQIRNEAEKTIKVFAEQ